MSIKINIKLSDTHIYITLPVETIEQLLCTDYAGHKNMGSTFLISIIKCQSEHVDTTR